ncbi:Fis family transcriptional regulator [Desulfosarcina alkanivorans]|uniref:Fis family transcriptional regulator n=1 Tax=Desulfosarcina alkanivorans TaxID=571177 RepID=A0A5K7YIQ2_9BACT|nr:sigma-54 dependent transcriptional regulator [Desulfosarcina alkanivorans]BBO69036.1 Fis family transcriptional regulator [Desulfosarcina alkanivorans]
MAGDTILVVDDESDLVHGLRRTIRMDIDCRVLTAENGFQALDILSKEAVDVVLADVLMPNMDGLTLLERIKSLDPAVTVIIMTAYGTIEKAVEAIKKGAYDLIQKPVDEDRLIHLLRKGLELNRLVRENARLSEAVSRTETAGSMVGRSRPMRAVFEKIHMLAQSDVTVLVRGDTGTGKDLAAQAIHQLSRRGHRKLITVNCPALPESILESELFGYRKGAFTHATDDHLGMFDQANHSSIFLDEIGDLNLPVQTKLLRVLQDKEIRPLGCNRSHLVDTRIIAATNRNLELKIKENRFREDLFYRLKVATLTMPSLDQIREDIPLLVDHFLERVASEQDKARKSVTPGVLNHLVGRQWPGNTRQLENLIRGWYAVVPDDRISTAHLAEDSLPAVCSTELIDLDKPYQELKEQAIGVFTLEYLNRLLGKTGGNVSAAAQLSGMKRQSLQKIIRRYGIDVQQMRS